MTGRGAGYCAGYNVPGCLNGGGFGGGRGGRGGGGGGWGRRNRFWATGMTGWQRAGVPEPLPPAYVPPAPVDPAAAQAARLVELKNQAIHLEQALAGIRSQIEALDTTDNE
jgi:hypothetical protein